MSSKGDNSFLQRLRARPLLVDGAMGTLLLARGASIGQCLEELSVTQPHLIWQIHHAYAAAGADVISTHTFGANRMRLAPHGLAARVRALNVAAVRLVQDVRARSGRAFDIAGNVGPVGKQVEWANSVEREAVIVTFREQIGTLCKAGVDLLLLETFSDVQELELAVQIVRETCKIPIVASMSYGDNGRTLAGQTAATVTARLLAAGADVVGVNCSTGPVQMLDTLAIMQQTTPYVPLSAMPNAGLPEQVAGRLVYPASPADFAAHVPQIVARGARLLGGCCGTTPEHISAMRAALDDWLAGQPVHVPNLLTRE